MRKNNMFILIIVLLLIISGCSGETISVEKGTCVLGPFTTTDMAGNPVNAQIFDDYKLTMINIWATFCGPCKDEMPDLAQLHREFGDDFQVVGIVIDAADRNGNVLPDKRAEAASIIETTGADYTHLLPSASLNKAYLNTVQSVPVTIFVDEDGNQVGIHYIGKKSKTEWTGIIEALLNAD